MAKKLHLVHVKSNVLDKAPSASTISYGEIAVNYNADSPALYIKDDEDNIVKFISEPYFEKIVGTGVTENDGVTITPISEVIQEDEEAVSAALNDLNDRKADKSDLDDAISGLTEYIDEQLSAATIEIDSELDSGSTNPVENRAIWEFLEKDEKAISAAFNDLNTRKANITYVDDLVSELAKADTSFSNALGRFSAQKADRAYVDTMISNVAVTVDSALDSGSTNPVQNKVLYQVIHDNELVMAGAINNLDTTKADRTDLIGLANASDIIITAVTISGSGNVVTSTTLYNQVLTVGLGNIAGLPAVTSSDNGKILRVVNGAWALVDPVTIYSGSGTPSQNLGVDGDIYLQTTS